MKKKEEVNGVMYDSPEYETFDWILDWAAAAVVAAVLIAIFAV